MTTRPNDGKTNRTTTLEPSPDGLFIDLDKCFDEWLESLANTRHRTATNASRTEKNPTASIYIESTAASRCEVSFEGVLEVEGFLAGNIRSFNGTLMTPEQARIEADIDVGVALINGCVSGNITANRRVVLHGQARVEGNIYTPSLSIDDGAVFEGQCNFRDDIEQAYPDSKDDELLETLIAV